MRSDELSLEEIKLLIRDLKTLGCQVFTMLGGEFLLRKDWYEIAQAVREAEIELNLITNGLLVTEDVRMKFKSLTPRAVGVSIDGATPAGYRAARGVDGFTRCRQLLNNLVSDGHRQVSAITTFSSRNIADFDLFVREFVDTPIVWQVQVVHKAGERFDDSLLLTRDQWIRYVEKVTDTIYKYQNRLRIATMDDFGYFPLDRRLQFINQKHRGRCPAGCHSLGLRANGDVLACLSLGSDFVEYNVRSRSLVDIWRDPQSFSRFRQKCTQLTGRCAKCPKAKECRAGCTAAALSTTGTTTENSFCIRQFETERILTTILNEGDDK